MRKEKYLIENRFIALAIISVGSVILGLFMIVWGYLLVRKKIVRNQKIYLSSFLSVVGWLLLALGCSPFIIELVALLFRKQGEESQLVLYIYFPLVIIFFSIHNLIIRDLRDHEATKKKETAHSKD